MTEEQIWCLIVAFAVLTIPFAVFDYIRGQRAKHHPTDQEYVYMPPSKYFGFQKIRRSARNHQFDYIPSAQATFEDQLKSAGMKPEQTVTFGQNSFAYDRDKGKLLVRSKDVTEGVLLHSREVLSYTLLRDGHIIAQRGRDGGEGIAAASLDSDCERIELRLETKNKDNPQITLVLMPFRFERQETRASAMDAARSIAAALEEILNERV